MNVSYAAVDTPLGDGYVAWNASGVVSLDTGMSEQRFVARLIDILDEPPVRAAALPPAIRARVATAIKGDTAKAPVDLSALPEFQQKVLKATMAIPAGQVRSYGEIARQIGHPGAARAVGTALAKNPIPLLVPCHRVVRGDGTIGNYGLGGSGNKRLLLQREGVTFPS